MNQPSKYVMVPVGTTETTTLLIAVLHHIGEPVVLNQADIEAGEHAAFDDNDRTRVYIDDDPDNDTNLRVQLIDKPLSLDKDGTDNDNEVRGTD